MAAADFMDEKHYRAYIEFSPVAVFVVDGQGHYLFVNPAASTLTGYSRSELLGKGISDMTSPAYIEINLRSFQELKTTGRVHQEVWLKCSDGHDKPVELDGVRLGDDEYIGFCTDISELKAAEASLKIQGVFLNSVMNSLPHPFLVTNAETRRVIYANEASGYQAGQTYYCYELTHHAQKPCEGFDHPCTLEAINLCQKPVVLEHVHDDGQGGKRFLEVKGFPIFDDRGRLAQIIEYSMDITDRKKMMIELEEARAQAEAIIQTTPDAVTISRLRDSVIVEVNRAFEQLSAFTRTEVVGQKVPDINIWASPEDRAQFLQELREKGVCRNRDVYFRRKDGQILAGQISSSLIDLGGEPHIISVARDITARIQSEHKLKESEELFRKVFQDHAAIKIIIDPATGKIIDANRAAENYYGWSHEELVSMTIDQVNTLSHEEIVKAMERAVNQKQNYFIFQHRRADGSVRDVEVYSSSIVQNGRKLIHSIIHDITERRQAELRLLETMNQLRHTSDKLAAMNAMLEVTVEEKVHEIREKDHVMMLQSRQASMGEMLGNIAHQWRQPLNALGIIIQNLNEFYDMGTVDKAYIEKTTAKMLNLIMFMSQTIDDFRNFFKRDKAVTVFSLAGCVHKSLKLVEQSLKNAGVEIKLELNEELKVSGHPNEFGQVLLNLFNNTRDAHREKQTPAPWISVIIRQEGTSAVLIVEDNAGGIPENLLQRVFEPYFTTKEDGTGIGLYMSNQIVEQSLHGTMNVDNTGGGVRFTIIIPLSV